MAQLALHCGAPAVTQPPGFAWPIWDDAERKLLCEVLESGKWWGTTG
jgi:hypothetical protein